MDVQALLEAMWAVKPRPPFFRISVKLEEAIRSDALKKQTPKKKPQQKPTVHCYPPGYGQPSCLVLIPDSTLTGMNWCRARKNDMYFTRSAIRIFAE